METLFASQVSSETAQDARITKVAHDWQGMAGWAQMAEVPGALRGVEEARFTELFGRIASAGEQLGLAGAANRDTRAWTSSTGDASVAQALAGRALSEITGFFMIGAAHGPLNLSVRALMLNTTCAAEAIKDNKTANGFAPFANEPRAWLPFNRGTVSTLETAATVLNDSNQLVSILRTLVDDPRWKQAQHRRDIDFHRWRPQSIEGGVAPRNPWSAGLSGERYMTLLAANSNNVPDQAELANEAPEGLTALTDAMEEWLAGYPDALSGLGHAIFTVSTP